MANYFIRRVLLTVGICIFTVVNAMAQTPSGAEQEVRTQLEAFEKQTGTVIVKGYTEIGSVVSMGSITVDCRELTNVSTGERQLGIVIEVKQSGRLERTESSFVDYDEITPLLSGIDYISRVTADATKLDNFEAIYQTKGDFNIVVFSSHSGRIEAAARAGRISRASAFISMEKLAELRNLIQQAKLKLDEIR